MGNGYSYDARLGLTVMVSVFLDQGNRVAVFFTPTRSARSIYYSVIIPENPKNASAMRPVSTKDMGRP